MRLVHILDSFFLKHPIQQKSAAHWQLNQLQFVRLKINLLLSYKYSQFYDLTEKFPKGPHKQETTGYNGQYPWQTKQYVSYSDILKQTRCTYSRHSFEKD